MKIVQAVGWYFPESLGGTEIYVRGLTRRLRAAGHEVLVAAPTPGAAMETTYSFDETSVYRYPTPGDPTRAEARGEVAVRGSERFHSWLAAQRPDVVHLHTFVTGLGLHEARAARESGASVIVTTHSAGLGYICGRGTLLRFGDAPCDGIAATEKCAACLIQARGLARPFAESTARIPIGLSACLDRIPGRLGSLLGMGKFVTDNMARQQQLLTSVDAFVVLADWAFDVVKKNGASATRVVVNRLGHSFAETAKKPGPEESPTTLPIRIGYLGRFDPIKGVLDLAEAFRRLPRKTPLLLEFRGPATSKADRRTRDAVRDVLGGDPRVVFAEPVGPEDVGTSLASYDVLCCPSRCFEGGPTVAIEAHAIGTPVIGTALGSLSELIADGVNGRLFPPGDIESLSRTLLNLSKDPASVDRWRARLPKVRSMDEIASDYLDLYAASRASGAP